MLNRKLMILAIFFVSLLAVSAVSAANNATDGVVSVEEQNDAEISVKEVASDIVNVEKVFIENCSDDVLVASDENISSDGCDDDVLAVSEENTTLVSSNELTVAVTAESNLSASNDESVLSVPLNQEDSKLTSIYDKVYSKKVWKTIGVGTVKLKYAWSDKKMSKVSKKKMKVINKRVKKVKKKYAKKGWTYDKPLYNNKYGKKAAVFKYYLQFYKTVYYDGYGNIL